MSTISNLIFKNASHYVSSEFGKRNAIKTSNGTTSTFHNGTDYATNGKKIAQYAIEDGYCFAAQKASDGALYAWIIYPRIKLAFLHYHLDSYKVKANDKVTKGTLIGYTGKTGKATGIHLHLGIRDISRLSNEQISKMTWNALQSCAYINPEQVKYTSPSNKAEKTVKPASTSTNSFFPKRGYFRLGDTHENVGKIATFMRNNFPNYTKKSALGNLFGPNLKNSIKMFQTRTGLKADGCVGPITLAELEKFGFKR